MVGSFFLVFFMFKVVFVHILVSSGLATLTFSLAQCRTTLTTRDNDR